MEFLRSSLRRHFGAVAKCRPFSQAINVLVLLYLLSSHSPGSSSPLSPEFSKNVFPVHSLPFYSNFDREGSPFVYLLLTN